MSDFRNRPRRRGAALNNAIIEATITELAEVGYARMTIESVARRAGAGKVSVYRRWPSRLELAMEAAYRLLGTPDLPAEPSTLRNDLSVWLTAIAHQLTGPVGEALRGVVVESLTQPTSVQFADLSRGVGAETVRSILDRARKRGEPVNEDLNATQERVPSALVQHHYLTHHSIDQAYLDDLIDNVVMPLVSKQP